ncbi:MAG: nucleotide exchange factor GrpE [Candidatus Wallbacteria bacterium HGW-Wallbacteria-1]|jgi:molecular chaperone GrpE|uniref:Nucleotide exchange factor GrpE n=1 Tax=Candidatus Wallbacteria bacterium HGW-Wallbacteria-1 TaxID=2013854 RepID=A0A2N1PTI8_9BACT|nr:MAG: nucleotide exchange factor GrpE [Candidatus Wallbacteria bacterium HGW-Wallbacteria-1]
MDEKFLDMDINKEFYKKLNQQIVQKDNLIRLLQKQIENLSVDQNSGADSDSANDERVRQLNSTIRDLREKLEVLQNSNTDYELSDRVESLIQDVEDRNQEIMRLKAEIERLHNDVLAGNIGNDMDPGERQALERRIKELTDRNMELQDQAQESAMLSVENNRLKLRIEELETSSSIATQPDDSEKDARIADLIAGLSDLDSENADLRESLNAAREENHRVQGDHDELTRTSAATIEELHGKIDELESRLRENASSGMETERLRSRVIELEDMLETLKLHEAMDGVTDDSSDEFRDTIDELEKRLGELVDARREADQQLEKMSVLNEKLSKKVADQSAVIEEIRGKAEEQAYEKLSKEKEGLLSQLTLMESRVQESERELVQERQSREMTEKALKEAMDTGKIVESGESRQAREELERLRLKIQKLEEERKFVSPSVASEYSGSVMADLVDLHDSLEILKGAESDAIKSRISALFAKNGIMAISSVGYPFDESLHIIGEFVRSGDYDEGTVVQELNPGFRIGDQILRKAEVVVIRNRLVCPSCDTLGREGSNYCDKCGTKLVFPTISPEASAPDEMREIGKVAAIYKNIGRSFEERGLFDKAEIQYCEALKVAPEDMDLLFHMASLYEMMGRYDDSIAIYERIRPLSMDKTRIEKVIGNLRTKLSIIDQIKKIRYDF